MQWSPEEHPLERPRPHGQASNEVAAGTVYVGASEGEARETGEGEGEREWWKVGVRFEKR